MTKNGVTPVTFSRHGQRSWRRFTSYEFARHLTDCPVVEAEILQVAAAFPIAFRKSDTEIEPVALLSLETMGPTPFVSNEGAWLATYVPSALRCPPFQASLGWTGEAAHLQLLVDESLNLIDDNREGEAFFDETGELAPELKNIRAFLQARSVAAQETRQLCSVLEQMNLFSTLILYQGVRFPHGLLAVDAAVLAKLTPDQMAVLTQQDALRLIHAHQVSLSHSAWLQRAHQQSIRHSETQEISGVSGFLDAVAQAHQTEEVFEFERPEVLNAAV